LPRFLVVLGAKCENIFVTDIEGVVYRGRKALMNSQVEIYAQDTAARTLKDVIGRADIFLGLSAGGVLTPEMVKEMANGRWSWRWPIPRRKSSLAPHPRRGRTP